MALARDPSSNRTMELHLVHEKLKQHFTPGARLLFNDSNSEELARHMRALGVSSYSQMMRYATHLNFDDAHAK